MKRLPLWSVLSVLLSCAAAPCALAVDLQCGQPGSGTLLANGTSTVFTFRLRAGDSILVRLIPTSATISSGQPIELDDPAGTAIRETFSVSSGVHVYSNLQSDDPRPYQLTLKGNNAGTFQMVYLPLNRACSANTTLTCGKPLKGLFTPGQMQTYQFTGKTGDQVSVRVAATDGSDPSASIFILGFDSNSSLQAVGRDQAFGYNLRGGVLPTYKLTTDGTQTFVIFETNGQFKLNYSINVVDLSGPCSAIAAGCGTSADGALSDPLATAIYSLTGAKGDLYQLRLLATDSSGGLRAVAQVFDPQGNLVDPTTTNDPTRVITLPANGQYTVVVQDANGTATGSFAMALSRLNSPCNAQPLSCGTPVNGQVTGPLRTTTYSVDAQAGDVYMVRLLRTSVGFTPRVEVYAPDTGAQVQSVTAADLGSVIFTAPAAGTYTLLAFDALDGRQTGSYTVWLGRLNRPCSGAIGLSCLFLAPGAINQPLQSGVYSYPTAAGDSFTVRLLDMSGNLQSAMQVYDPRGVAVQGVGGTTKAVDVTNSPGGAYTILVTDQGRTPAQGTFGVEAINTKGTCGSPISAGASTSGLVSGPVPAGVFTLSASAGDTLLLRSAAFTPGFAANMDLYDPSGRRLGSGTSVIAPPALPASGVYTAVITASAPRTAGKYVFAWQLLNNPSANALQCGQTTSGALGADNQFWYYSLSANEGDLLKLLLTRLPGSVNAQLELFDGRGTRLAVNNNEIVRKVSAGNYLVLVSPASANAEIGGFGLALEKPNHPCSPNSLTCGQTTLRQVTAPGQLDAFPFSGNAGDAITVTVTPRTGGISPVTELYDASGNAVGSAAGTTFTSTLAATGQYTVTVHDRSGATGSYRVGLQRSNNACPENDSEKPTITLRRPTGGDVIAGGAVFQIVWQSDDNEAIASHSIGLSTDGGKTFQPISGAASLSGVAQSFNWLVPADIAPARNAMIQVTAADRAGNVQSATSDILTLIGSGFTANASATYEYDALNRLSKATYQDGRVFQYSYDAVGNLTAITVQ